MRSFDPSPIVDAVRKVVGPALVGHHDALVTREDKSAVEGCLDALSNHSPLNDLERQLEKACKVSHAVATSSGTAALHAALMVLGVGPDDAVLVPTLTFAAAAAAITYCGAVPIFLDAFDFSLNFRRLGIFLEREALLVDGVLRHKQSERRIAALIAVHMTGDPCDIAPVMRIAARWGIPVIEDAAQALGSAVGERPCGSWGKVAVLSFNYNKIVTGGGGGALLTDDPNIAGRAQHMVTTARLRHPWLVEHDAVGWNYRMPTMCAALASSQISRLPEILRRKSALAAAYEAALKDIPGVEFHAQQPGGNHWLNTLMVDPRYPDGRDALLTALHEVGIGARAIFTPLHKLQPYRGCVADGTMAAAVSVFRRAVCLPSGIALGERL